MPPVVGSALTELGAQPTIITGEADRRREAVTRYLLGSAVHRMVSECERMLEHLDSADREAWRETVGDGLVGARHLLALLRKHDPALVANAEQDHEGWAEDLRAPQDRVIRAMNRLLALVPFSAEDELLQRDARAVRETALDLLTVRMPHVVSGATEQQETSDASGLVMHRILVVDDEHLLRQALTRMLFSLGHDVVAAGNGRSALDIAMTEPVDLVLTDINMPEIDGLELLRLLKGAERTRDIPVIVISSLNDVDSIAACIDLGAEDHIAKPYDSVLLQARVRASLERKRMRDGELDYLRRVAQVTAAAEAVEQEIYVPGSLKHLARNDDELGRLARVFDRMVVALRMREERLYQRLRQLRSEMGESSSSGSSIASVSLESPLATGEILAGRYEIHGELGRGGMGMVYRARDRELDEDVAIKVVRKDLVASNPQLVERLKSEIRLARRLPHRNIVRSHDLGEWSGIYFITMEFVEGLSVKDLINRRGRLTVESTVAIATQLADALIVAHEQDIIHRDIKPENLLIDNTGCLKVTDFGLARPTQRDMKVTDGGFVLGSPLYMSPEQFRAGNIDARTDLYAVGVVLYEALSGRTPYDGDTVTTLYAEVMKGNAKRIDEVSPDVPGSLAAIVHQLLERKPADRIPSARELARRLAEIETGTLTEHA